MDKSHELENLHTGKLLWQYFIPAFIGFIMQALYNVVDRIFIGQSVGVYALSGLTLIFPIMMVIMAFGTLTGIGTGVLVSINMGRKDINRAEKILGTGFLAQLIIAVLVTIFGFIIKDPLLDWLQPLAETRTYAEDYLDIILLGVIFQTTGWGLNNVIRSQGYAKIAMYSMVISALLNVALDAILILGFDMGVKGAAIATVISTLVLSLWVLYHLQKKRTLVKLKWHNFRIHFPYLKEIFAIGFAPFAMHLANSAVQIIQNDKLILYGGDKAVSAMGIISSLSMLFFMTMFALNTASQPIMGYNYGANRIDRVRSTLKITIIWATGIAFLGFFVGQFFPKYLIILFNTMDKELLEIGVNGMKICFMLFPIIGFQVVVSSYFQSVGKANKAALLSLLRQVVFLIPLFLILPRYMGLDGIWYSWPLSDLMSAIVTAFFLYKERHFLSGKI